MNSTSKSLIYVATNQVPRSVVSPSITRCFDLRHRGNKNNIGNYPLLTTNPQSKKTGNTP